MIAKAYAAVVDAADNVRSLVRYVVPDEITDEQVADVKKLSRIIMRISRDLATVVSRPSPRRIDYESVSVLGDGTTVYRFPHGFSGPVRWWVVDTTTAGWALRRSDESTSDVLALVSEVPATVTIRVEEVGG